MLLSARRNSTDTTYACGRLLKILDAMNPWSFEVQGRPLMVCFQEPHVSLDGGYIFLLMPSQEQLINEYFNKSHHGKGDSPAYPVRDMHDAPDQNSGEENGPDVVGDP